MARWADDPETAVATDIEGTFTLPARYYTDPTVLENEREQVLARSWQYLGDVGRVASPGDFLIRNIAGRSVILIRDDAGELRGLHNVCAHRGSRILDGDEGCRRRLQCPYHGWTFDLDGSLIGAPNFSDGELDPDENGLRSVTVETLGPMVFATLDPEPEPLASRLGSVTDELAPFALDSFDRVRTVEYEIDCNWKVYVDNYLECDHCELNHPTFVDSLDMDEYEIVARDTHVAQFGQIERDSDMDSSYGDRVDPTVRDRYVAVWLWPNLTIDVSARALEVARVRPDGHDHTTLVVDYYNRDGRPMQEWEEGFAFSQQVMREDVALCERQFDGLQTGVFGQGRLGPNEHGVHRFQQLVQDNVER